jgi:hypothetical protein
MTETPTKTRAVARESEKKDSEVDDSAQRRTRLVGGSPEGEAGGGKDVDADADVVVSEMGGALSGGSVEDSRDSLSSSGCR